VIGALAQATSLMRVTTAVTCPTVRIHPAIIAQAAATASVLLEGRFTLGLGSGEALNEHILGDRWPAADERLEMLEEAIEVIRALWQGGNTRHRGRYYTVENARVYDLPDSPPEIFISGFAPKSTRLAGRIGDGFCTVMPDGEAVQRFREHGGAGKPVAGGMKVCYGEDAAASRATAHRLWPIDMLPGELAQILPTPTHFEQVTEDQVAEVIPCGPDIDAHIAAIQQYADAGFDELYIQQIGGHVERFFDVYTAEILPRFR
jgi:G6PDH family F420-dependent oxidoreductase